MISNIYFVYQCWSDDKLYKTGLTRQEAIDAQNELNCLIESGCCGEGEAVIGRLDDSTNYWLCKRLGILMDFYTIQQMKADGFVFAN